MAAILEKDSYTEILCAPCYFQKGDPYRIFVQNLLRAQFIIFWTILTLISWVVVLAEVSLST